MGFSLDTETDAKIQSVIRSRLGHCTVLMVAHRLHTLYDFDRVAVIDAGRVAELGEPRELLKKEGSMFSELAMRDASQGEI